MAYPSSTPSWQSLAALRKRGQKPARLVLVTEYSPMQRERVASYGVFALPFPQERELYAASGLDLMVIGRYSEQAKQVAMRLATVNPSFLATWWHGQGPIVVLGHGSYSWEGGDLSFSWDHWTDGL